MKACDTPVIVRGGGDLASGIVYRLRKARFPVLILETSRPLVVRRTVSFAQAVFDGEYSIEGEKCVLIDNLNSFNPDVVNIMVDPGGKSISEVCPEILVDAIMAKRKTGTDRDMARFVVAIGPGFSAPRDVHAVIETKRGHFLGRVITNGSAIPDTGIPGIVMGVGADRLLRAPADGMLKTKYDIGDMVNKGDIIGTVGDIPVAAKISGVIRGLIHPSVYMNKGVKMGDIDPRCDKSYCYTISDKSFSVAGGVMEAINAL